MYRLKIGSVKDVGVQTDPIIDEIRQEKAELRVRETETVSPTEDKNKDLSAVSFEECKNKTKEPVQGKSGILGFFKNKIKNNGKVKSVKCKSSCEKNNEEWNKECGSQVDSAKIKEVEHQVVASPPNVDLKKAFNPNDLYNDMENNMRLSRLEEKGTLIVALRLLVRHLHPRGSKITFNSPDAADRLELKTVNLPTDPLKLQSLVLQAYKRRGEDFSLEQLYADFAKIHGRITLDPKKEWPLSHVHTYHP